MVYLLQHQMGTTRKNATAGRWMIQRRKKL
jgi:hypothetical protein